jgi:hypothetical protein
MQAYLIMKDVNPHDIPASVQVMHEENWNAHSASWLVDNMENELKIGGDDYVVRLAVGE